MRSKKKISFLGGLNAQITFDSACVKLQSINDDIIKVHKFLQPEKSRYCHSDIYLYFFLLSEYSQENGRILLVQKKFVYRQIGDDYFQLSEFADKKKKEIIWSINIDKNFSRFQYCFFEVIKPCVNYIEYWFFNRFLLQHTFINHHGLIIHAAGGSIHGKGMVFPAVSGTGKSTLSHLLSPFPENQLYSEERIIMRRMNDGWQLWGTPWKGTGSIARNESAPLSALVFLSQAPQTKISELTPPAALRRLLETVSIPWYSQEWIDKGLAVCESLLRDIPAFELAFRPDETAVQAVEQLAALLD